MIFNKLTLAVAFSVALVPLSAVAESIAKSSAPTGVPRCMGPTPLQSAKSPTDRWGTNGQCDLMSTSTHVLGKKRVYRRTVNIFVDIPESAKVLGVRGLMHNEPWGGSQHPPKPNTDDLGTVDNKACPIGDGDCPIAWSRVGKYSIENISGMQRVYANFQNWAGRNDRTGTLEVTFSIE